MRSAISDTFVLTGRNFVHLRREPARLSDATIQPVIFTLLFIYVLGAGIAVPGGYKEFAIAGLLAINLVSSAAGTAVALSEDLSSGVIDRFRTLAIWKPAILVARSLTDLLTALLCGAFVVATGLVIGWTPHASALSVAGGLAVFVLFAYALSWGCACLGIATGDAEASQGIGLVILLPLGILSNALVPTQHMTTVIRAIANWSPVSAVTAASRKLLGNPNPSASSHAWPMQHPVLAALAWSLLLLVIFAPLAVQMYQRRTAD